MRKCGVCRAHVDYTFNMFEKYVGTPPVPLSKVLIKCTHGTTRKYIRGGVCQNCFDELVVYYEALQTAKRIRNKILELIEEYKDDKLATIEEAQNSEFVETAFEENLSESVFNDAQTLIEVIEPLSNNIEDVEEKRDKILEIDEDYMISAADVDDADIERKNIETDLDTEDEGEEIGPKCNVCGEGFADYRSCKVHKAKMHPKRYVCQLCGKVLSTNSGLKKHIKLHNPEKPLSCVVCGKRYHFEVDLRNHEAWHTGERPYECPECGKRFANYSSLSCHKISHKPLPEHITCDVCGRKFRKPSRLKAHQLTHATIKNHACPYCKYCTANKASLNWHLKNNKKCSILHEMDSELIQTIKTD